MKKILNWIKNHKIIVPIITVLVFAAPLVVVHVLFKSSAISSLRIKKQGEVKNFCRSHPAGPRRIGLAQSSGKSTLPTKE